MMLHESSLQEVQHEHGNPSSPKQAKPGICVATQLLSLGKKTWDVQQTTAVWNISLLSMLVSHKGTGVAQTELNPRI